MLGLSCKIALGPGLAFVLTAWSIAASFGLSTFVWEQIGMMELVFPVVLVGVFFVVF